ncbi:unnamed protein product [Absidia cylindrospora]
MGGPSGHSHASFPNKVPLLCRLMTYLKTGGNDFNIGSCKNDGEQTPLVGDANATRKRRRCKIKVTIGVTLIVVVLVVFAIVKANETVPPPKEHPPTDKEKLVISLPSAQNTHDYLKKYTSEAHLAGTPADERQAQWTMDKFAEFGLKAKSIPTIPC